MRTRKVTGVLASSSWRDTPTAAAQMEMKIGYGTIGDPQHAIAQEIQKRIGGNKDIGIKVSIFPAGQIGKILRMIEGIQFGTLETLITPPGFVGINPVSRCRMRRPVHGCLSRSQIAE